jgi:hypothetical protein
VPPRIGNHRDPAAELTVANQSGVRLGKLHNGMNARPSSHERSLTACAASPLSGAIRDVRREMSLSECATRSGLQVSLEATRFLLGRERN